MNFHKELLLDLILNWSDEQLQTYITNQENRLEETRTLIRELREMQRKRTKKTRLDTGERGGK